MTYLELKEERKSSMALMKLLSDEKHKSEALAAELAKYKARSEGTTHAVGCWAWGKEHYLCAAARVRELEAALPPPMHTDECAYVEHGYTCDCGYPA